jgi:structural maintenance of chromosome 1
VSHNILVKAKNFLVFQGDVEAVASQSPKDLTRLIEQISGSLELASEYEKAREKQEQAAEQATHNFNKRRGINHEIKQYRDQKAEADRFADLVAERDEAVLQRVLWKLWHIEQGLERDAHDIRTRGRELGGLKAERDKRDAELASARAEQAKARSSVIQKEKKIKKAEQALENKVYWIAIILFVKNSAHAY